MFENYSCHTHLHDTYLVGTTIKSIFSTKYINILNCFSDPCITNLQTIIDRGLINNLIPDQFIQSLFLQ